MELMYWLPSSRCNKQRFTIIPVLPEFWNLLYPSDVLPFYLRQRPSCVYVYMCVCVHGESSLPREYAISSSGLRSTPDTREIPAAPTPVYCHCDRYCVFTFTVRCADVFKPFCINVTYHLGNFMISSPPAYSANQRFVNAAIEFREYSVSPEEGIRITVHLSGLLNVSSTFSLSQHFEAG